MKGALIFALLVGASQAVVENQKFMSLDGPLEPRDEHPMTAVEGVRDVPLVGEHFRKDQGVTVAMQCVISLTIQFMLVYTALAICRMAADSWGLKYDNVPVQKILQTATL